MAVSGPLTLEELRVWATNAPPGTSIPVASLAELLSGLEAEGVRPAPEQPSEPVSPSWRERLWTCPAETRLGIDELCQALDRPRSWVYRRTSEKVEHPLPHRKFGGSLTFTAGELRAWIRAREEIVSAGPYEATAAERRLRAM